MTYKYFIAAADSELESTKNGDYQLAILKIQENFARKIISAINAIEPKPHITYYDFYIHDEIITCHWIDSKKFYKHNPNITLGEISRMQYENLNYNTLPTDVIKFVFNENNQTPAIDIVCTPFADNTNEIIASITLPFTKS